MSENTLTAPAVPFPVPPKPKADGPVSYSFAELRRMTFEPDHLLIGDGLLQKNGIMIIGGPPKTYKSFVLGSILYHLATGTNLFGATRSPHGRPEPAFVIEKPHRVLLFEQEIGYTDVVSRYVPLFENIPPEHQSLFEQNFFCSSSDAEMKLDKLEGAKRIEEVIALRKPDIVAFDPLFEFHNSNENDAQQMGLVLKSIDVLRQKYNFATILCHHTSKQTGDLNGRRGGDLLRGSSALFGKADSIMLLEGKNRAKGQLRAEFIVRRGKPLDNIYINVNFQDLRTRFKKWQGSQQSSDDD